MPLDDPKEDDPERLAAFERQVTAQLVDDGEDPGAPTEDEDPNAHLKAAAAPAAPAPAPSPTPAAAPAAAVPAPPAPAAAAAPSQAPAAPAPAAKEVDLRQAVRAARHDARVARERAEALAAENARLKAAVPAAPSEADKALEEVESLAPGAAKFMKSLDAKVEELRSKSAAPAPAPTPAFVPMTFKPELQDAIDQVDELYDWQHSQEHQGLFELARAADLLLYKSPAWQGKPVTERLQEATRIAKEEWARANPTSAPSTPQDAAAAAAAAAASAAQPRGVTTLSDLRGGASPANHEPNYHQMTDEQIMAQLARSSAAA
jgi:hypothetical protein